MISALLIRVLKGLGTVSLMMNSMRTLKQPATRARRIRVAAATGPATSKARLQARQKGIAQCLVRSVVWFLCLYVDGYLGSTVFRFVPLSNEARVLVWLYALVSLPFVAKTAFRSLTLLVKPHEATLDWLFFDFLHTNCQLLCSICTFIFTPLWPTVVLVSAFLASLWPTTGAPAKPDAPPRPAPTGPRQPLTPIFPGQLPITPAVKKKSAEWPRDIPCKPIPAPNESIAKDIESPNATTIEHDVPDLSGDTLYASTHDASRDLPSSKKRPCTEDAEVQYVDQFDHFSKKIKVAKPVKRKVQADGRAKRVVGLPTPAPAPSGIGLGQPPAATGKGRAASARVRGEKRKLGAGPDLEMGPATSKRRAASASSQLGKAKSRLPRPAGPQEVDGQ